MKTISFPNLGINGLEVDRTAFSLFGKDIYWYGILIASSIILSFFYVKWRARREHVKGDDIYDLAIWVVIFGIIGARAYYVLTTLGEYDSFLDVIAIWNGGIAFYGCLIGGAVGAFIVSRVKKISFAVICDMLTPAVLISQAIGRWGNFFNGEAYGSVTTYDFLGKTFDISGSVNSPFIMNIEYQNGSTVTAHPTFLYECVWYVIGFIIITSLYKRKKFNGMVALEYLAWNGFGRMFVEGLRTDSLYIGSLRISQLLGLLMFLFGTAFIILGVVAAKKGKLKKPFDFAEETEKTDNQEKDGENNGSNT